MMKSFLSETAESRWKQKYVFQVSKGKKEQFKKLFFKTEDELMSFSEKENLRYVVASRY